MYISESDQTSSRRPAAISLRCEGWTISRRCASSAHLDCHERAVLLVALGIGDGVRAVDGLNGDLTQVFGRSLERAGRDLVRREMQEEDLVDGRRLEARAALVQRQIPFSAKCEAQSDRSWIGATLMAQERSGGAWLNQR